VPEEVAVPPRLLRGWRAVALGAAVVVLLSAGGWWLTHPAPLRSFQNRTTLRLAVGQAGTYSLFVWTRGTVHLREASPVLAAGADHADVRVLMCRTKDGTPAVFSLRGKAEQVCAATRQVSGSTLHPPTKGEPWQVVVEVVPRSRGTVVVDGIRLAYRDGLRRGSQLIDQELRLQVG
jgi:hypothetical protein